MSVLPEGKGKMPVTMTIPNTSKPSRTIDPPAAVKTLAGQLKVGDPVKVTYETTARTCTFCSAEATGNANRTDTPFTFIAVRRLRHAGKEYQAVFAARGSLTWAFLIPNGDTGPDPELVKKTKEFRRGSEVRLTYEPFEYTFVLKDIEAAPQPAE
ncbi:MAG: hypothetical protein AMK72_11550 [Planctomycetes bacterium SM23_25]|nr:MAG: hypothetical protein AMK72_11550 [Planctomycetes bacterium SM23_25]